MKKITLKLTALVVLQMTAATLDAQTSSRVKLNTVTTAVPFLRISPISVLNFIEKDEIVETGNKCITNC